MGVAPPYPVSGRAQKACMPAWGLPPNSPSGWGNLPPPLLLYTMHWERTLLRGFPLSGGLVCLPPLPLLHAMRWECTLLGRFPLLLLLVWGVPPSIAVMPCAGSARCRLGGSPPSSVLGLHVVDARGLYPSLSCPRTGCTFCWGWGLPSLSWAWPHVGSCAAMSGDPLPPLAAARVKRTCPVEGYPRLVLSSVVALHGERALQGFVPLLLRSRPL